LVGANMRLICPNCDAPSTKLPDEVMPFPGVDVAMSNCGPDLVPASPDFMPLDEGIGGRL